MGLRAARFCFSQALLQPSIAGHAAGLYRRYGPQFDHWMTMARNHNMFAGFRLFDQGRQTVFGLCDAVLGHSKASSNSATGKLISRAVS
jgi:hypothetical protein